MNLTITHWILIVIVIVVLIIIVIWMTNRKGEKKKVEVLSLASPENLLIKPGDSVIDVKWNKVEEADFYTLYMSETSDFEKIKKLQPIPESKIHIAKIPIGNYWIKVSATKMIKDKGLKKKPMESSSTKPMQTCVTLCSPPETPLVTLKRLGKDVEINWNESYNAEGYIIYVNNDKPASGDDKDHALIQLGPVTEHILKDLPEGFEWNVGVKSFTSHSGKSEMSNQVQITL